MGLDQMGLDKVGIHQLTCTVAVKGVTVVKEVHTKEVQEGIVAKKCKKEKKSVKFAYVNTLCTNKSLGFMCNTYTHL